jgi:hypothetical protein
MSATLMSRIKNKQKKNDIVYTPSQVVDIMIKFCNYSNEYVLDSCRGKGAFYNKLNYPKEYCEITEDIDFFSFSKKVELSIGNPPYSILSKWLEHTYKICDKFCYIFGMYSLTSPRLRDMEKAGFYITKMMLINVPTWFQRSYIIVAERLTEKPDKIVFDFEYMGNKCLYCGCSVGGMKGKNIKHCKRKMADEICSY